MLLSHRKLIVAAFTDALQNSLGHRPEQLVLLERPKQASHGDVACNAAMQFAKPAKRNPRELAQELVTFLQSRPELSGLVEKIDIAGPGFINLTLSAAARQAVAAAVLAEGERFGRSDTHANETVLLEFVSANPTGPLHVGHGRQGALGDCLANLMETQGWQVHREFYYNDAGVQIQTLAISVQARCAGEAPGSAGWPENAYNGDYIADIARDFLAGATVQAADVEPVTASGDASDFESIRRFAVAYLRREQDLDLKSFGVRFDQYYLESSLYTDGKVEDAVNRMVASGNTYEFEGALWLKTTDFGDDKDRVMRKSEGGYTYFVPDVAYHVTKWQRGYQKVVNIQGSDHHGTIARVRAGLQTVGLGIAKGYPDYVLHKMVTVMRNGEEVKISKRAGSYVTLRDLICWSGNVAEQQAWDTQEADTEFVFDVDLALSQSDENPVYYVQYAHARICSILNNWGGDATQLSKVNLSALVAPKELALMNRMAAYQEALSQASEEMAPHQIAFYLRDLAADFHGFYNAERVLVDDETLKMARLALLQATRQVLRNGFSVLGVSAPERM
ncbi:MAG: arginine--tRNA ligase [Burkholderiales bacterium]|nr:arginine--tRNA ligase [Burkholderiales bacterium]